MRFQIRETYYNKAGKKCFIHYSATYPTRADAIAQVFEFMRGDRNFFALEYSDPESAAEIQTCTYTVLSHDDAGWRSFVPRLNNNLSILI